MFWVPLSIFSLTLIFFYLIGIILSKLGKKGLPNKELDCPVESGVNAVGDAKSFFYVEHYKLFLVLTIFANWAILFILSLVYFAENQKDNNYYAVLMLIVGSFVIAYMCVLLLGGLKGARK